MIGNFNKQLFSDFSFMSIIIIYNGYTVMNNILIKIDGVVYIYIADITNRCKYYNRNKQNLDNSIFKLITTCTD